MSRDPGWEHFHHEADIGVRGFGGTQAAAFEQAALAMTAVILDPEAVEARSALDLAVSAPDPEMLLYEWLNALVYEMATRRMLFGDWRVTIDGHTLDAVAIGETVDRERHEPVVEVKGATYTALSVSEDSAGVWHGQCIVDV